jgi:hypothetical protein
MEEGYDSDSFQECCCDVIEAEGPQNFDTDEVVVFPPGVAMYIEPEPEMSMGAPSLSTF